MKVFGVTQFEPIKTLKKTAKAAAFALPLMALTQSCAVCHFDELYAPRLPYPAVAPPPKPQPQPIHRHRPPKSRPSEISKPSQPHRPPNLFMSPRRPGVTDVFERNTDNK